MNALRKIRLLCLLAVLPASVLAAGGLLAPQWGISPARPADDGQATSNLPSGTVTLHGNPEPGKAGTTFTVQTRHVRDADAAGRFLYTLLRDGVAAGAVRWTSTAVAADKRKIDVAAGASWQARAAVPAASLPKAAISQTVGADRNAPPMTGQAAPSATWSPPTTGGRLPPILADGSNNPPGGDDGWVVVRNFNDSNPGDVAENFRTGNEDGFDGAAGRSFISTEHSAEGGQSAELNITKGDPEYGWGTWGGGIDYPAFPGKGKEIWFRVKIFMPAGFDYSSPAQPWLKFMRIRTRQSSGAHEGYLDVLLMDDDVDEYKGAIDWIFEPESQHVFIGGDADRVQFDKWETYEVYAKLDDVPVSAGGQGRSRVWKNGVLLADITNRKTLYTANSVADFTYLFTYWNGGAPKTQKLWVDDIVIATRTPGNRDAYGNAFIGTGNGFPNVAANQRGRR